MHIQVRLIQKIPCRKWKSKENISLPPTYFPNFSSKSIAFIIIFDFVMIKCSLSTNEFRFSEIPPYESLEMSLFI